MNSPLRSRKQLAVWVAAGAVLASAATFAQTSADQARLDLLASGIRAREAGNLQVAKERFEEALRMDPNNAGIQRLLAGVNSDLERQMQGQPTVFGRAANLPTPSRSTMADGQAAAPRDNVDAIFAAVTQEQDQYIDMAEDALSDAQRLIRANRPAEADRRLADVQEVMPVTPTTAKYLDEIAALRSDIFLMPGYEALEAGNLESAREIQTAYAETFGSTEQGSAFGDALQQALRDPAQQDPDVVSPGFSQKAALIDRMLVTARARMMIGDYEGALETLRQIEARSPELPEAKALQIEVLEYLDNTAWLDRQKTREEMLREVSRQWQRPQIFDLTAGGETGDGPDPLREKLRNIVIPRVEFNEAPLSRVVATLSELTVTDADPAGVNIVMSSGAEANVPVTVRLRGATMEQILNVVTQYAGFAWDVREDLVQVERSGVGPGGAGQFLETEFFPISRGTVVRMTGDTGRGGGSAVADNPFAAPAASSGGSSTSDTEEALQSFFQRAGIDFEGTPGSSLAYDGSQIIVTQTPRNIERMRTILRRYDETNQVEIEAKFLEVQQGVIDQLGFNWSVATENVGAGTVFQNQGAVVPFSEVLGTTGNRNLEGAFSPAGTQRGTRINNTIFPDEIPSLPDQIDLGSGGGAALSTLGILGGVEVGLVIDALSRSTGSDLLSSPRLTVLSGRTAEIVVAQELIYPESYAEAELPDIGGGGDGGSSSGFALAPGAPEDFTVRNVGVEMEVTPTVEQNRNISLELEPQVTDFEGFIEYGGTNIVVGGDGTVVTTPSGFLQPIFSTRRVRTNVTVFDGATVVIGGLVREQILTVEDKVPVLGDIPLLGRLFRSEGESVQKRNLLIFVTANLISPGGSSPRQQFRGTNANALFQNPIIVTPGGAVAREVNEVPAERTER